MSPLRLRVRAGAKRNALLGMHAGALKVSVTAAPEKGKANRAVLALLAGALGVTPSTLELAAGASSPDKTVLVPLSPAELAASLAELLNERADRLLGALGKPAV